MISYIIYGYVHTETLLRHDSDRVYHQECSLRVLASG